MTERDELSELLVDVFGVDVAERERLLASTVRRARRHRRLRVARRIGGAVAVGMLGVFGALRVSHENASRSSAGYEVVHTTALPPAAVVETAHAPRVERVSSLAFAAAFHTTQSIPRLSDEQLLAFAGPRPVALIRTAPHEQRLLFLDEADHRGGHE